MNSGGKDSILELCSNEGSSCGLFFVGAAGSAVGSGGSAPPCQSLLLFHSVLDDADPFAGEMWHFANHVVFFLAVCNHQQDSVQDCGFRSPRPR